MRCLGDIYPGDSYLGDRCPGDILNFVFMCEVLSDKLNMTEKLLKID